MTDDDLLAECEVWTGRHRGPGGQHRNKTDSAVVLRHRPSGIEAQAGERRSQIENRRVALKRLRRTLAVELQDPQLAANAPTELWRSRTQDQKLIISDEHDDFPPLLAEALSVLADHRGHLAGSALQLGVTSSQLQKLLQKESRAWAKLQRWREESGQSPLEGRS